MALTFPDHGGEMGRRIREHDWSSTPLGPIEGWPDALRTMIAFCLDSRQTTSLCWGPQRIQFYNDAWARINADRHPLALGRPAREVWADIWDDVGHDLDHVFATGEGLTTRDTPIMVEHDGALVERYFSYSITPVRDADGHIVGALAYDHDSTRLILAERASAAEAERARKSEERLQLALDASAGIGVWDWDVRADRVFADDRFARLFGIDPALMAEGAAAAQFFDSIHPEDVPRVQDAVDTTLRTGAAFAEEYRVCTPGGRQRWIAAQGRATFDADGRALRFPGVAFDVTKRREAEEAARAAATDLRLATEAQTFVYRLAGRLRSLESTAAILRLSTATLGHRLACDRAGFYRLLSDDLAQFVACWHSDRLDALVGTVPLDEVVGGYPDHLRAGETLVVDERDAPLPMQALRVGTHAAAGVCVPLRRGGKWAACLFVSDATPRHWTADEVSMVEAVAEVTWDAVERADAVTALRESEEKFRAIANSIDQMIWSTQPDGFHDYYNERWYEYTGVPHGSTDGDAWNGMFHPDDQERAMRTWHHSLATGDPYRIEYRLRHASGIYRWVLGSATPVRDEAGRITRWFGTCTDIQEIVEARDILANSRAALEAAITERTAQLTAAEEQLRQAQKMEALGQLTGGIAHDFNNMLAVVIGALDLLERRVAQGRTDISRYVDAARDGATRAAQLTQRLLSFSRQNALAPVNLDANDLVAGMTELLARTIGEAIAIETDLAEDLWPVVADRSQLENAVVNLAVNARDAMPRGGRLTIATANVRLDPDAAALRGVAAGAFVGLTVGDTGVGMDADVAAKAFDPFFTTKSVGKGTGLGLSQVFGFVRQSGGHVAMETAPDAGTTVTILLPRAIGAVTADRMSAASSIERRGHAGEVVLVVEDEERVRNFSVEALRELGYTVVHAASGPEALAMIDAGQGVNLLFTDVVMPEMTGRELADAARARIPGLPIVYTSGYTRDAVERGGTEEAALLRKPFDIVSLADRIRTALDA